MTHPDVCSEVPEVEPIVAREQAQALHDEIQRLPVVFRRPVVLCYIEGLTVEEAARQLRWPRGTVCSRLARRATNFVAASRDEAWSCQPPPRLRFCPKTRGRQSHLPYAKTRPAPRSNSRPERPAPGPCRPRQWLLPIRC